MGKELAENYRRPAPFSIVSADKALGF